MNEIVNVIVAHLICISCYIML